MTAARGRKIQKSRKQKKASPRARSKAARQPSRRVFRFGNGRADGNASMKTLLGGKGADLAEMSRLGLPVPPGFTLSTEVCGECTLFCKA